MDGWLGAGLAHAVELWCSLHCLPGVTSLSAAPPLPSPPLYPCPDVWQILIFSAAVFASCRAQRGRALGRAAAVLRHHRGVSVKLFNRVCAILLTSWAVGRRNTVWESVPNRLLPFCGVACSCSFAGLHHRAASGVQPSHCPFRPPIQPAAGTSTPCSSASAARWACCPRDKLLLALPRAAARLGWMGAGLSLPTRLHHSRHKAT